MDQKKILIVDDEVAILELFSTVLASTGHLITTAKTAKEARELLQIQYYNLVLLDIGLPDMQGTNLIEKIRKLHHEIIIIIMTGNPDLQSALFAINKGANGYLVKPISVVELLKCINEKLQEQDEEIDLNDEKMSEWIKNRLSDV